MTKEEADIMLGMSEEELRFSKQLARFLSFFGINTGQLTKMGAIIDAFEPTMEKINSNFGLIKTDIDNIMKKMSEIEGKANGKARPLTVMEDLNAGAEEINNG